MNIECLDKQSIYWTNRNTGKEQTDHILSKKLYIYRDEKAWDVFFYLQALLWQIQLAKIFFARNID